jgi:hypothetical protein
VSIAEVVRDLFRADDQPEQSYSERQIFEAATSRLARELAAMEEVDEPRAQEKILKSCAPPPPSITRKACGLRPFAIPNRKGRSRWGRPFHCAHASTACIVYTHRRSP